MTPVTAIVQARMGSTRLPGKVMLDLAGRPVIWHVLTRLAHARSLDRIIVATTELPEDDALAATAESFGIAVYRGSEDDVLDRYYQAASRYNADPVVRVTSDCPLVDPQIADAVISHYLSAGVDYVSIGEPGGPPTFPDGLDLEVFSYSALTRAWGQAKKPSEREHVTPYIIQHPEAFTRSGYDLGSPELGSLRLTLDDEKDYVLITEIYDELYEEGKLFVLADVLALLVHRPELLEINRGTVRNEGYLISLEKDRGQKRRGESQ